MSVTVLLVALAALAQQIAAIPLLEQFRFTMPFSSSNPPESGWTTFGKPIKKVAVIGAGPAGLQAANALHREGFEVRLIERADGPGGNWKHNHLTPIRESYTTDPTDLSAIPVNARPESTKLYDDGDDGLTLEERWREHSRPSPVWDALVTNSAPVFTSLPDVEYPKDAPWALPAPLVQRHVRSYASAQGLNINDLPINASDPVITAYSTRVELLEKDGAGWKLSLRHLERLPDSNRIKARWWQEKFDAVVVATGGYDIAFVPTVKGLVEWSNVKRDGRYPVSHSQHYRNPQPYHNKTVLLVGASVSASEISRNLTPHVNKLYISIRNTTRKGYMARRSIRRIHPGAEIIPEVIEFGVLRSTTELGKSEVQLANGTWIGGIDEVILATGYRRANPFLRNYFKKGAVADPKAKTSPILTDGHSLSSLSWTGHYIPDPTLAFTNVRAWTLGRYQSLAFAKVWKGTARIPDQSKLWHDYYHDNHWQVSQGPMGVGFGSLEEESLNRQYVAWLNHESLVHGGRFVDQWPIEYRERFAYYSDGAWEHGYTSNENFTRHENTPRSQWPLFSRPTGAKTEYESLSEW